MTKTGRIRARQRLGKYRIDGKLGEGGFAAVYRAMDTLEGVRVALKIPHDHLVTDAVLDDFRNEVRLAAKLRHPNILPLKNADMIEGRFVIAYPLGQRTLADRLQSRIALDTALSYADQMLAAVAYAHGQRVIHCDIKPENLILFSGGELMLTDFGIAKVAMHTIRASGSGTVGFCAPEQAMGKPSFRSDVFALGLVMYRMFSGKLPEWPFDWPPPGYDRLRRRVGKEFIALLRKAISVDPRKRFADAGAMRTEFRNINRRSSGSRAGNLSSSQQAKPARHWRTVRQRQFKRQYGKKLATHCTCSRCRGPISETMTTCPWCGVARAKHDGTTRFPLVCPRCNRGLKRDWEYCPWCYGGGFQADTHRHYSDARYTAACKNPNCRRKELMPFMRYCPWCRTKVTQSWKIEGTRNQCPSCNWGVVADFWSFCPWCGKSLPRS